MRLRKPKRAAVLGSGPAGMFATHALIQSGWTVDVLSRNGTRSDMYGAQYLHESIPGLSDHLSFQIVQYKLIGTEDEYRAKVYGPGTNVKVSPGELAGQHRSWDIRDAYDRALAKYEQHITHSGILGAGDVVGLLGSGRYKKVVSSIPAPDLCVRPGVHLFGSARIWAIGDAPQLGVRCPIPCAPYTVVCNGLGNPSWYRVSNVWGHTTAEWPWEPKPPIPGLARVTKPISTNCDCLPDVVRVGRFGTWTKGVLAHHAYYKTLESIR